MKWSWDFRSSPTSYGMTSAEVKVGGWFLGGNFINMVTIKWKRLNTPMAANSTLLPFVFKDAEVIVAGSNITQFKLPFAFNRKSKWRTWNRMNSCLKLIIEYLWNLNGILIFVGRTTGWEECSYNPTSGWVRNLRWQPATGSRYLMTYISACIHDGNEIPTVIPMFSLGQATRLHLFEHCPMSGCGI